VSVVATGVVKGQSYSCGGCGKTFVAPRTDRRRARRFCSKRCVTVANAAARTRSSLRSLACARCGAEFSRPACRVRGRKRSFCSVQCARASSTELARRGAQHPRWKGGRRLSNGYVDVLRPEHELARKDGYVAVHRLVISERIGRMLAPTEVVHHVDGSKSNNDPSNLWLWPDHAAHAHWHEMLKNGHQLRRAMAAVPLAGERRGAS
jgi:hypothetical protein